MGQINKLKNDANYLCLFKVLIKSLILRDNAKATLIHR